MPYTFIFADMSGFTALTEIHGDEAAADLAAEFSKAVAPRLGVRGAEEVKSIGDALLIRCEDAGEAIGLGLEIVHQVGGQHRFPTIRAGMHTGQATERDGDWFGATVNVAARVAGVAAGGEVLLTDATRDALQNPGHFRNYTFHIVPGNIPAKRAPNTLYTQTTDPDTRLGMSIRNYLPDRGRDGTGDVGLPKLVLNLADGTKVRGQQACAMLDPIEDVSSSTFPASVWKGLVAAAPDPENAPATNPPTWEKFWNALYSVAGVFISDPFEREATYPPTDTGGFQSNPDTRYLLTPVSLRYGSLITVSGKMPTYPKTLPAARKWNPKRYQVRYWSLCSGSSPVTGLGYDCVYDQQVPLRKNRRYTLVIGMAKDRPPNARAECGYRWINFGAGENYPDPASRDWVGTMYMRFMAANPGWKQAPQKIKSPGTEKQVMGPYFPTSKYWTKSEFRKLGCKSQ